MNSDEPLTNPKIVNKAIGYACRILSIQEYSIKSISQKIVAKGYTADETAQAVQFLLDNNWLSEQRFCEVFVRSKINRGHGLIRIRFELQSKGIDSETLESVFSNQAPINWQLICDRVTQRKIDSAAIQNNIKDRQKLERFLQYRGFSGEQIRSSINQYIKTNNNPMGVEPGEYDE